MFGWFKTKPKPQPIAPAREETTLERRARWEKEAAERKARLEKLEALDRRGEVIRRGDTVWHNGQEMAIIDAN